MENSEIKKKIGARIRQLRLELDATQEEFAKMIGVSGKTIIANYESGYSTPNDAIRDTICLICNCSMDYLTCKTDIKTPIISHTTGSGNEPDGHRDKEIAKHNTRLQENDIQVAFSSGFAGLNEENKKLAMKIIAGLKAQQDSEDK